MLTNAELLYEYERAVTEKKKTLKLKDLTEVTPVSQESIVFLLRYVFEKMLHWTPAQVYERFDMKTAEDLKLDKLVEALKFPEEMKLPVCCFYTAAVCYPEYFGTGLKERTLLVYRKVLAREIARFPEAFFDGTNGKKRLDICMEYAADNMRKFVFEGRPELVFPRGGVCDFLEKYRLYRAASFYYPENDELKKYAASFLE